MKSQRDMMRTLYQKYGQDEATIVREYASAEKRGEVARKSNTHDYDTLQYARALWRDGIRKGWIYGS